MAIEVISGVTVTVDETDGLQNATTTPSPTEDANDNDILLASLPSAFSTRLGNLGASTASAMEAALSGYTGAAGNTGSNAFTLTPDPGATITDVSFVGSGGAPLTGLDSGLDTLDGTSILLYTDTSDNNILLGRAGGPTGAIVFAAYIEETYTASTPPTLSGGKIWTVLYQPLKHTDANDHDFALNLLNKVYIGASQDLEFSLKDAPSGQNLFLMFTTANPTTYVDANDVVRISDPTIIATGKDPANQSTGVNISTGDTINTSQAGGPTTFGTNSQMITEQEGIRFTFVTGARQDVTIPNLSQTEADLESNIDFTGVVSNIRTAEFDIVQLQSGKSAQVKISAFATAAEPGVNFIDGYSNDTAVTITNVRVFNSAGQVIENSNGSVNDPSIAITFSSGVATITGVTAGLKIEYTTSADHHRVLIENGAALDAKGNNHADFDIGGFSLRQTSANTAEIGSRMIFEDDGPSIDPNAVAVPTLTTDDTDIPDTAGPVSFAGLFTSAFGQDSFKDSDNNDIQDADAITYALGVSQADGADSGLRDTLSGDKIFLFLEGGAVVGRVGTAADLANAAGAVAFTISVVANTGNVTLVQSRSIVHDNPADPIESGASAAGLSAASLVTLTATITDGDGDTDTATRNIGDAFKFEDDGPSIDPNAVAVPTLTTDDTDIPDTAGPVSFAGLFTTPDFGEDSFKDTNDDNVQDADAITYALGVSAPGGVDSGLRDSLSGNKIFLFLQGGAVVGRVGTAADLANAAGAVAFTISVVANTGNVSLAQDRSVMHNDPLDPVESGASAAGLAAASLVTLTATITDGDGDTDTATRDVGDAFKFEDDGPSIAFGNLVGTGTDLAQYGFWMMDAGADGPNADELQIALTGFMLGGVAQAAGSFSLTEVAPDVNGEYKWNGSLTGDFNNDGTVDDDPLAFTLTARPDGTYALDLATPVQSTTTTDTADGGLGAGGPDPVQTLFIPEPPATPTETVVFFSAKIDASAASIAAGIILGATDPTEEDLEGPPPASFIDPRSMNVSTAGIGVDNNNMNGYGASGNNAVIDDPDGPDNTDGGQNTPSDDSFVVNPGTLVDMMRVFIDNSVTGYDYTAGERLQYRIFYENGTWSNYMTVVGDLGKGDAPKFFEIDGAGQKIDAVQLTMLYGEIKIPNIQFVTVTESVAQDISLDFTASLTDKDGDTVSSNFSADLFTNEPADATFDYELIGTALVEEAFDVDLASTRNDYKITGFDANASPGLRDTLVLIGDPTATVQSINNSGDDSIVTIAESAASGGQITTITVVGVDLLNTDIVFGA